MVNTKDEKENKKSNNTCSSIGTRFLSATKEQPKEMLLARE